MEHESNVSSRILEVLHPKLPRELDQILGAGAIRTDNVDNLVDFGVSAEREDVKLAPAAGERGCSMRSLMGTFMSALLKPPTAPWGKPKSSRPPT